MVDWFLSLPLELKFILLSIGSGALSHIGELLVQETIALIRRLFDGQQ